MNIKQLKQQTNRLLMQIETNQENKEWIPDTKIKNELQKMIQTLQTLQQQY